MLLLANHFAAESLALSVILALVFRFLKSGIAGDASYALAFSNALHRCQDKEKERLIFGEINEKKEFFCRVCSSRTSFCYEH